MANVIILVIGHHIPMQQIEKLLTIACLIFVLIDKDLTKNRDDCIQSLEREQNMMLISKLYSPHNTYKTLLWADYLVLGFTKSSVHKHENLATNLGEQLRFAIDLAN